MRIWYLPVALIRLIINYYSDIIARIAVSGLSRYPGIQIAQSLARTRPMALAARLHWP